MAPPETRKGDPGRGRPSIAAFNISTPRNTISAVGTPDLVEVVNEALGAGALQVGGRFRLHGRTLRREGGH